MSIPRVLRRMAPPFAGLAVLIAASGVLAQDRPGQIMSEPIGYTSVADAFEENDPFDVNVHLAFRRSFASGAIEREVIDEDSQDGRSGRHFIQVAQHEHDRNELLLQLDVGVYRDLMVYARFPLVLGDDRDVLPVEGRACTRSDLDNCEALLEPRGDGLDEPLFDLSETLRAKRRSGLPRIDLGIAWGVMNQYRDRHLANWVLIVEGSIDTGAVISPCVEGACNPGLSTGTAKLKLESRWSYRYRYFEPFAGIAHTFQWVTGAEELYNPAGELRGAVDADPPSRTEGVLGVAVIPWEDRGRFQRFEVDLSAGAALIESGRDTSPLFDALGASNHDQLTRPNFDRLAGFSIEPREVPFTGLTNVEAYAELSFDVEIVMQAARYVRFALGAGLSLQTSHFITGAAPCNTEVEGEPSSGQTGTCDRGIFNPYYRPVIDAPGQRFRVSDATALRLSAAAVGQF